MTKKTNIKYEDKKFTIRGLFETDHIFKHLFNNKNFYELTLLEKVKSMNLNGVYVDVGANIGNHTIFFSENCSSEKVISIELDKTIFEVLEKNVSENKLTKVELLNIGVGDEEKFVKTSNIDQFNVGMTKILEDGGDTKINTLDNLLEKEENISLLKIDVEGYESNVILGAKKILKKHSPIIIVELETTEAFESFEKIVRLLGYKTDKKNYGKTPTYFFYKETIIYDYVYLVPSFERFDKAKRLIDQIISFNQNSLIITLNDGSKDERYNDFKNYNSNLIYLVNKVNNGKFGYWKTMNKLFSELSNYDYNHVLMLNDDFVFINNFTNIIEELKNDSDIIRLFTPTTILGKNWEYEYWIDGAFCAPKNFLEKLNYEIFPIKKSNSVSSGVGHQMTRRLNDLKFKVLNYGSLVSHEGNDDSVMHPEHRKKDPLVGVMYVEDKFNLSVIIPTYDNIEYIEECLNSIIVPDNIKLEVLVGIDGCENTLEFLKNKKFKNNFSFYFFPKNVGPYVVKNSLVKISNSENILFFDSDDVMCPNMINEMISKLEKNVCVKPMYHDFENQLDQNDPKYQSNSRKWGEGVFAIKKSIFLEMNGFEGWKCAADSDFMNRLYKHGTKIHFTGHHVFFRRIHNKGLTSRPDTGFYSKLRKEYFDISKNKKGNYRLENMEISVFSEVNFEIKEEIVINKVLKPKDPVTTTHRLNNEKRYAQVSKTNTSSMTSKIQFGNHLIPYKRR